MIYGINDLNRASNVFEQTNITFYITDDLFERILKTGYELKISTNYFPIT